MHFALNIVLQFCLSFFRFVIFQSFLWLFQIRENEYLDTIITISAAHGQPPLLQNESQYEQQQSCVFCWLAYSPIANTRQPVSSKLKHDITKTLSLDPFFSHNQPLDRLWSQLHHTLTPQSKFLKQSKPIWQEPLCSRDLSITVTILRFRWYTLQRAFIVSFLLPQKMILSLRKIFLCDGKSVSSSFIL